MLSQYHIYVQTWLFPLTISLPVSIGQGEKLSSCCPSELWMQSPSRVTGWGTTRVGQCPRILKTPVPISVFLFASSPD